MSSNQINVQEYKKQVADKISRIAIELNGYTDIAPELKIVAQGLLIPTGELDTETGMTLQGLLNHSPFDKEIKGVNVKSKKHRFNRTPPRKGNKQKKNVSKVPEVVVDNQLNKFGGSAANNIKNKLGITNRRSQEEQNALLEKRKKEIEGDKGNTVKKLSKPQKPPKTKTVKKEVPKEDIIINPDTDIVIPKEETNPIIVQQANSSNIDTKEQIIDESENKELTLEVAKEMTLDDFQQQSKDTLKSFAKTNNIPLGNSKSIMAISQRIIKHLNK